ncbi:MAG: hypothetical protein NW220_11330 [Leptolyngbyaceae cyanobacterium bins.349]|nr:hypothetical protein [Leptolyngbyaceae cyanobacterium bins.349]
MLEKYTVSLEQGGWENLVFHSAFFNYPTHKIHDYSDAVYGVNYVFEQFSEQDNNGYMTAQRRGVAVGDYILLRRKNGVEKYRIQSLDYYSSPSDMWVAFLEKCNEESLEDDTAEEAMEYSPSTLQCR